jgi:diguanylate cyclase (GGDEF)-like protein/PAS domain S-box-containing protein
MNFRFNSLRFVLPGIICLFVLLVLGGSFYSGRANVLSETVEANHRSMLTRLSFIQGAAHQFLRLDQEEDVRAMVANMSHESDLISFVVVSSDDVVAASNSFRDIGLNWQSLTVPPDLERIRVVLARHSMKTFLSSDEHYLDGYSSLCTLDEKSLRSEKCGFIFYRINMNYHYAKATKALLDQAVFVGAGVLAGVLGLLIIIHLLITTRVEKLIRVLGSYANGNRTIRSEFKGNDELGLLSRSMDELLARVELDEKLIIEKEMHLETLFQTVADPIITIDRMGIISHANQATEILFGYSVKELVGCNVNVLMPASDASKHDDYLNDYKGTADSFIIGVGRDLMGKKKDGEEFPIELSVTEMSSRGEKMFTGIIRDITARKELETNLLNANERLKVSANTDSLTGLSNRRKFDLTMVDELNRATRTGLPLSLLLCDVDYFKFYNDTFGHLAGDECLQRIGALMREQFGRSGDLPCRYGGEEFAIILPGHGISEAKKIAETLRDKVVDLKMSAPDASGRDFVTLSIGFATYKPSSKVPLSADALIKFSDEGLYKAKEAGRNRVEGGVIAADLCPSACPD